MRAEEHRKVYALEDSYWWYKAKRRLALGVVNRLTRGRDCADLRVLDAGCGTGAISAGIQEMAHCVSTEKFPQAIDCCRQRKIRNLVMADAQKMPFKKGLFDVILALDILEHLDQDRLGAMELSYILKDSGVVVVHVPAFMFLWNEHDQAVSHKRRYTAGSLKVVLEAAGFEVLTIRYRLGIFFMLGMMRKWMAQIKRLIDKERPIRPSRPRLGRWLNYAFYAFVVWEDRLPDFLASPFGLSILCIAKKKGKDESRAV